MHLHRRLKSGGQLQIRQQRRARCMSADGALPRSVRDCTLICSANREQFRALEFMNEFSGTAGLGAQFDRRLRRNRLQHRA